MTFSSFPILRLFALCAAVLVAAADAPRAQSPFAPAIKVGDRVITGHEIQQRTRMLQLLNAPGDPQELAREQLIEDRLKLNAAERFGVRLEEEELAQGKAEFAARADLETEQFEQALQQSGVSVETFTDFVTAGLLWRKLVRGRFGRFVNVTDRDIDRALTSAGNGESVRVLISEIFLATPPGQEAQARQIAEQIAQIRSLPAFADAARRYSAAPTRQSGGRVNWMKLSDLPGNLRSVILDLEPGEVTAPLPVEGAIALFQLRAIEEGGYTPHTVTALDYAAYYIDGGRSEAALARAAELKESVDTCDDLYGVAKDQPESVLDRGEKPVAEVPQDVAYELAKLDAGEVSTALTRSNGQTLVFLMLCDRVTELSTELDEEQVRTQLTNQQLDQLARGLLEEMRAETRIVVY